MHLSGPEMGTILPRFLLALTGICLLLYLYSLSCISLHWKVPYFHPYDRGSITIRKVSIQPHHYMVLQITKQWLEQEGSLPYSQEPAIGSYTEPVESIPHWTEKPVEFWLMNDDQPSYLSNWLCAIPSNTTKINQY